MAETLIYCNGYRDGACLRVLRLEGTERIAHLERSVRYQGWKQDGPGHVLCPACASRQREQTRAETRRLGPQSRFTRRPRPEDFQT